jgi:methylmalonyl-CoA mutase C-terminal domain/subunit
MRLEGKVIIVTGAAGAGIDPRKAHGHDLGASQTGYGRDDACWASPAEVASMSGGAGPGLPSGRIERMKPPKFLLACDSSGHTAGYHVVAMGLRDAGVEVVALGYAEPEEVARAALEEDVDLIGYRVMDRDAGVLGPQLLEELTGRGLEQLPVVIGGIVGRDAKAQLLELGIARVFGPGSKLSDITDFVLAHSDAEARPREG